jgi:hypothetical protein
VRFSGPWGVSHAVSHQNFLILLFCRIEERLQPRQGRSCDLNWRVRVPPRGAQLRVPEHSLNDEGIRPLKVQKRAARMPRVVEAYVRNARVIAGQMECLTDVTLVQRRSRRATEEVAGVIP